MSDSPNNLIREATTSLSLTAANHSTLAGAGAFSNGTGNYTLINTGTITAIGLNNPLIVNPGRRHQYLHHAGRRRNGRKYRLPRNSSK